MNKSRREGEGANPDVAEGSAANSALWGDKLQMPLSNKGPVKPSDANPSRPRSELPVSGFVEEGE